MSRLVASVLGVGYVPRAGGTVASLLATLAGAGLLGVGRGWLAAGALAATIGGWAAVRRAVPDRAADPSCVVIDEVAGQWIALLAAPPGSMAGAALAFVLFRVFDVTKWGPVGWADRQHGAFGIMADDVIAGLIAAGAMVLVRVAVPGWEGWRW